MKTLLLFSVFSSIMNAVFTTNAILKGNYKSATFFATITFWLIVFGLAIIKKALDERKNN